MAKGDYGKIPNWDFFYLFLRWRWKENVEVFSFKKLKDLVSLTEEWISQEAVEYVLRENANRHWNPTCSYPKCFKWSSLFSVIKFCFVFLFFNIQTHTHIYIHIPQKHLYREIHIRANTGCWGIPIQVPSTFPSYIILNEDEIGTIAGTSEQNGVTSTPQSRTQQMWAIFKGQVHMFFF